MQEERVSITAVVFVLLAAFVLILLISFVSIATAESQNVIATVTVNNPCPFVITLNALYPFFVQPSNIVISYNVVLATPTTCPYTSLTGNAEIVNATTNALYGLQSVNFGDVTTAPTTGNFYFSTEQTYNSASFPQSADMATVTLTGETSNSAVSQAFDVVVPANVTISNLAASPQTISSGASVNIESNLTNNGALTATNAIVNIEVAGPGNQIYTSNEIIGSISPGSTQFVSLSIPGSISTAAGTYTATENAVYYSSYTISNTVYSTNALFSKNTTTTYTVQSSGGGGGGGGGGSSSVGTLPTTPPSTSQVTFSQLPVLTSVDVGSSTLAVFGFTNQGTSPIWVNFSTPNIPFGTVVLSSKSVYLLPAQTLSMQVFINVNSGAQLGTYFIPINMIISLAGQQGHQPLATGQTFVSVRVSPNSTTNPTVTQTSILSDNSRNLTTTLDVYNPTNVTIHNAVVSISLPSSTIPNSSDITAGGDPPTIEFINGTYKITWNISQILPHDTSVLFYLIRNVQSPLLLSGITATFFATTQSTQANLKIIDISAPIGYVNSTEDIRASALYTGPNATSITLTLSGPTDIPISQPTQVVNVVPNGAIQAIFVVGPMTSTGTKRMQLSIYGDFPNQTYSIPLVVLPTGAAAAASSGSGPQITGTGIKFTNIPAVYTVITLAIVGIVAIAIVARRLYRDLNRARYDDVRAHRLMRMRDRISREGSKGGEPDGGNQEPNSRE